MKDFYMDNKDKRATDIFVYLIKSIKELQAIVSAFPDSNKMPDYMLPMLLAAIKDMSDKADEILEIVEIKSDPNLN